MGSGTTIQKQTFLCLHPIRRECGMRRALHFSGQGKEDKTRTETFLLSCKIQQKAFQKKIGEWYQEKVLVEE
jgi:hypothetical protein